MKLSRLRGGIAAAFALGLVVIVGAATPSGHARGISYDTLNPIQKKHVSGALAQSLGPASSQGATPNTAAATRCVNPTGGGDEADEADTSVRRTASPHPRVTAAGRATTRTTRRPDRTHAPRSAATT